MAGSGSSDRAGLPTAAQGSARASAVSAPQPESAQSPGSERQMHSPVATSAEEGEVRQYQKEAAVFQTRLDAAWEDNHKLQLELDSLQTRSHNLERELAESQKSQKALTEQNRALEREYEDVKEELAQAQTAVSLHDGAVAGWKAEKAQLVAENTSAVDELIQSRDERRELEARIASMSSMATATKTANDELLAKVDEFQMQQEIVFNTEQDQQRCNQSIDEMSREVAALASRTEEVITELEEYKTYTRQLEKIIEEEVEDSSKMMKFIAPKRRSHVSQSSVEESYMSLAEELDRSQDDGSSSGESAGKPSSDAESSDGEALDEHDIEQKFDLTQLRKLLPAEDWEAFLRPTPTTSAGVQTDPSIWARSSATQTVEDLQDLSMSRIQTTVDQVPVDTAHSLTMSEISTVIDQEPVDALQGLSTSRIVSTIDQEPVDALQGLENDEGHAWDKQDASQQTDPVVVTEIVDEKAAPSASSNSVGEQTDPFAFSISTGTQTVKQPLNSVGEQTDPSLFSLSAGTQTVVQSSSVGEQTDPYAFYLSTGTQTVTQSSSVGEQTDPFAFSSSAGTQTVKQSESIGEQIKPPSIYFSTGTQTVVRSSSVGEQTDPFAFSISTGTQTDKQPWLPKFTTFQKFIMSLLGIFAVCALFDYCSLYNMRSEWLVANEYWPTPLDFHETPTGSRLFLCFVSMISDLFIGGDDSLSKASYLIETILGVDRGLVG